MAPTRVSSSPIQKNPCEYSRPCTTTPPFDPQTGRPSPPPRKVISHIFGRNKTATKRFPPSVWIYYCRRHYQRCRYRVTHWPFIQCDLLEESLRRMERWGGVRAFAVVLRRRELQRLLREEHAGDGPSNPASTQLPPSTPVRRSARRTTTSSTRAKPTPKGVSKKRKANGKVGARRKTPQIVAAPVPDWLREEVGSEKSFDEVRGLLGRVREYMAMERREGRLGNVRFPDIEILPAFREWVAQKPVTSSSSFSSDRKKGRVVMDGGSDLEEDERESGIEEDDDEEYQEQSESGSESESNDAPRKGPAMRKGRRMRSVKKI